MTLRTDLACYLLLEEFGPPVQAVCKVLLEWNELSLEGIIEHSGLDGGLVRECLMVGIQHNFVNCVQEIKGGHGSEERGKKVLSAVKIHYYVLIENVLIRIRFPRFIQKASELFGVYGEHIINHFLLNGRSNARCFFESQMVEESMRGEYLTIFSQLKNADYLVVIENEIEGAEVGKEDGGSEKKSTARAKCDDEGILSRVVEAKKTKKRVSNKTNSLPNKAKKVDMKFMRRTGEGAEGVASVAPEVGLYMEGKETTMMVDEGRGDFPLMRFEEELCLMVNYRRFNGEFVKEMCVGYVSKKIDVVAGYVVKEMFKVDGLQSVISEERLYYGLMNGLPDHGVTNMSRERLKGYLDLMSRESCPIVVRVAQPMGYSINREYLLRSLKEKHVESVVMEKFGSDSLRIFRIISSKQMLEQKQVSELSMTSIKETRDCLYSMLLKNYLSLQEVPRTSDFIPSKAIYLWTVDLNQVVAIVINEIYKIMKNLIQRLHYTLAKNRDLLSRKEEEERLTKMTNEFYDIVTVQEREQLKELASFEEAIESSLENLDHTLMILQEK